MSYYLHLAKQYMWHNKARTVYSILGIMLTFILCFCILTTGYSVWDYRFYSVYSTDPYELFTRDKGDRYTREMVDALKRMADDPSIRDIRIYILDQDYPGDWRLVLPGQLKVDEFYKAHIKLNSTKDLRGSAAELSEKYGFEIGVMGYVEKYLMQDDSMETALYNFLITFGATVFGLFSVVILRNTMMIAVTERNRDYGLLRCVGMSDGQNMILLLTEGVIMCLIASVLGLGAGFEMLKLIEPWIIETLGLMSVFAFHFYPSAALYTTLLCIGVTLFSLVEPARLSSQVSPLEALHGVLAKELTVGKALKLLVNKAVKRKSKKVEKTSLYEKWFGASGFYAHRNSQRGRGSGTLVFIAIFISTMTILTFLSFADSLKASMLKALGGKADEYREIISTEKRTYMYDAEWNDSLRSILEGKDKVTDTFSVMYSDQHVDINESPYFYNEELKRLSDNGHGPVSHVYEMGCNAEDMEKERIYLTEGEIDYDKMLKENGILLCDISPLLESEGRKTSYHAGDSIDILSIEGAAKAEQVFMEAVASLSERLGVGAWNEWQNGKSMIVYFENGEKKMAEHLPDPEDDTKDLPVIASYQRLYDEDEYNHLRDELLDELMGRGYDCREKLPDNNYRISKIEECLREILFEEGYVEELKVMGILSNEVYTAGHLDMGRVNSEPVASYIRIIYPVENLCRRLEDSAAAEGVDVNDVLSYYCCETGVKRNMDILDGTLREFAEANGLKYENRYGDNYFEAANRLNVATIACMLVGIFILLICIIQVINTLQADMRIRRNELRLYDVVGMDPKQKLKMMLIEHGFGAGIAVLLGVAVSFAISYTIIKRFIIMRAGTDYVFAWPVGPAFLITSLIFGTVIGVNLLEWKRAEGYIRDRR